MAKIPIILEPGRADGKLAESQAIYDSILKQFQSDINGEYKLTKQQVEFLLPIVERLNDVQDTLTSIEADKPLSAKQGKVLKELLDTKVIEIGAVPIDSEPIEGNITHVVNSDGLSKEFNKCNTEIILGGIYDVSAHNNGAVFKSLSALLNSSYLNTLIPTSVRHGGMSIRFVQSSDNKYVQYRHMSDTFSTIESDWQGVDDEPTAWSNNLVKSGAVKVVEDKVDYLNAVILDKNIPLGQQKIGYYYDNNGRVQNNSSIYYEPIDVSIFKGEEITVKIQTTGATTAKRTGLVNDISNLDNSLVFIKSFNENSFNNAPNNEISFVVNGDYLLISASYGKVSSVTVTPSRSIIQKLEKEIQQNLNDIKKLDAKTDKIDFKIQSFKEGVVFDTIGKEVLNADGFITDFIQVNNGDSVSFTTGDTQKKIVTLYSLTKEFVDYYAVSNGYRRVTVPEGVNYVRMSGNLTNIENTIVKINDVVVWKPILFNRETIEALKTTTQQNMANIETLNTKTTQLRNDIDDIYAEIQNYTEGVVISSSGVITSNTDGFTTCLINVLEGQSVVCNNGGIFSAGIIALYDANRQFVDYYNMDTKSSRTITISENIAYIRMSGGLTNIGNANIKIDDAIVWFAVALDLFENSVKEKEDQRVSSLSDITIPLNNVKWIVRKTIVSSGALENTNYSIVSDDYIPINGVNFIKFAIRDTSTFTYTFKVALYDKNENFINLKKIDNNICVINYYAEKAKICVSAMEGEKKIQGTPTLLKVEDVSLEKIVNTQKYEYDGEIIVLRPQLSWNVLCKPDYSGAVQDGCSYGDKLFVFHGQNMSGLSYTPCIEMFDLAVKKKVCDIPYGTIFGADLPHHNSVNFGKDKYSADDDFPIIYSGDFVTSKIYVLRLVRNDETYSLELLQTITTPTRLDGVAYSQYTNFIDNDKSFIYVGGARVDDNSLINIDKFNLPIAPKQDISYPSIVDIPISSKLDSFNIQRSNPYGYDYNGAEQGGIIYAGKLYWGMGHVRNATHPNSGEWVNVIDLEKKKIVSTIPCYAMGMNYEIEGVFVYNGKLGITHNTSGPVVLLSFD